MRLSVELTASPCQTVSNSTRLNIAGSSLANERPESRVKMMTRVTPTRKKKKHGKGELVDSTLWGLLPSC